jgi:hypothetical protein
VSGVGQNSHTLRNLISLTNSDLCHGNSTIRALEADRWACHFATLLVPAVNFSAQQLWPTLCATTQPCVTINLILYSALDYYNLASRSILAILEQYSNLNTIILYKQASSYNSIDSVQGSRALSILIIL